MKMTNQTGAIEEEIVAVAETDKQEEK